MRYLACRPRIDGSWSIQRLYTVSDELLVANPTTYTSEAGLAVARLVAEGLSLRRIVGLIPRSPVQLSRWARLPDPEFRRLLEVARRAQDGDEEAMRALFAPPGERELLDRLLAAEVGR